MVYSARSTVHTANLGLSESSCIYLLPQRKLNKLLQILFPPLWKDQTKDLYFKYLEENFKKFAYSEILEIF